MKLLGYLEVPAKPHQYDRKLSFSPNIVRIKVVTILR